MSKGSLYIIEHWALAEPDAGRRHLIECGFDVRVIEPWRGEALPELTGEEAGVMVMGGPQMVTEASQSPFLFDEFRFIEDAMGRDVPLAGICLGSQMIAHVMGARVDYHPQEHMAFGFYDLKPTGAGQKLMAPIKVLGGNAQGWDLPAGAVLLAKGDEALFPNQAFQAGETTIALQFHPEVTRPILDQWQTEFGHSIGRPGTQPAAEQDAGFDAHDAALKAWYFRFLDSWFGR